MDLGLLIHLVEGFPNLYDKSRKDFKDRDKKANSWKEIGGAMAESVDECQRIWKNLRERYVREKKRENPVSGSQASEESVWEFFRRMSFLEKHTLSRRTISSMVPRKESPVPSCSSEKENTAPNSCPWDSISESQDRNDADGSESHDENGGTEGVESDVAEVTIEEVRSPANKRRRLAGKDCDSELTKSLTSMAQILKEENKINSDVAFGQYVGAELAEMPKKRKNRIKRQILQLLGESDSE